MNGNYFLKMMSKDSTFIGTLRLEELHDVIKARQAKIIDLKVSESYGESLLMATKSVNRQVHRYFKDFGSIAKNKPILIFEKKEIDYGIN